VVSDETYVECGVAIPVGRRASIAAHELAISTDASVLVAWLNQCDAVFARLATAPGEPHVAAGLADHLLEYSDLTSL
jgi:hypothetical protein